MTDSRLRELERRYLRTGSKVDELAYDAARVRAGVAMETGFLERLEDRFGEYGARVGIHLKGSSQIVSLEPLISDMQLVDFEFVNGRICLLTQGMGVTTQCWMKFHVFLEDGRTDYVQYPRSHCADPAVQAIVGVDGELGLVSSGRSGTSVYIDGEENFRLEGGAVFDYSDTEGYLSYDCGTRRIVSSESNGVLGSLPEAWGRESGGVYVMGGRGIFCTASGAAAERNEIRSAIPSSSRFAQERFVAPVGEELERYHGKIQGGLVRVIREIPKKNLEGLLARIQKTVDAKSASRGINYD